jgi:hypothetical protein
MKIRLEMDIYNNGYRNKIWTEYVLVVYLEFIDANSVVDLFVIYQLSHLHDIISVCNKP